MRRSVLHHAKINPLMPMPVLRSGALARAFVLFCLFMLVSGTAEPASAQISAEEYQVKAAFLFHFAQLVDWPPGALNASDTSLNLCILDDEPRRKELQSAIEGKLVGARTMHLRLLGRTADYHGCNLLFLSRDQAHRQSAILKSLYGLPIVTVGESPDFLSEGGMICFHLDQDKIRFDINLGAADSAHLSISSRLLLLASNVKRGDGAERKR
jgi:hypothetical protein